MTNVLKICFVFVTALICINASNAQTATNVESKSVEWVPLDGHKNEFSIHIPAGYITAGDANFFLKSNREAQVNKKVIAARYINGIVLWMEYYEGDAKEIQLLLLEREKLNIDGEESVNGFQITRFSGKLKNRYLKTQHFLIKNRLYIIKIIEPAENSQIAKGFLESIRLVNQSTAVAPNSAAGTTNTSLPKLLEREAEKKNDSELISAEEADRQVLILSSARAKFSPESRRSVGDARLKLKVLFSSSGKVTDVQVLESTSKILEKEAIEATKKTIFIPAEKDGKLISVYKTMEHSFRTY